MKVMRHSHGVAREGGGSSMCVLEQRQSSGPSPRQGDCDLFLHAHEDYSKRRSAAARKQKEIKKV